MKHTCHFVYIVQHDVQFSCAINQSLLAHHWMVHQGLLTPRFIAPSIPWGVSAPGGKMLKHLLKDHNFLNNSPIFIIEISTFNILFFKKHWIQYISMWKVVLDLVKGTWHHNFMAGCGPLLWANTCSLWSGIKLDEWRSGSVSALPCERPGFASRARLREIIPANNCTMQGQNNWGNWGSPGVMKLWVAWEVLRWLMKFRELCNGGFHPKLVTPPYYGFLNVNTPPNSQNSKRH